MNTSLTIIYDSIDRAITYAAVFGGGGFVVGYFLNRAVTQINPYSTLICGATAGATTALLFNKRGNIPMKIIGIALLILVPERICRTLDLPINFKVCLAFTAISAGVAIFAQMYQEKIEKEKEEKESKDNKNLSAKKIKEKIKDKLKEAKETLIEVKEGMVEKSKEAQENVNKLFSNEK